MFGQQYGYSQQYQQRLAGRLVSSASDVGIGEVPTDGSRGWFPAHDGSCVWAKRWNANGTIETTRYVPEAADEPVDELAVLKERVAALESAIAKKAKRKEAALEDDRGGAEAA